MVSRSQALASRMRLAADAFLDSLDPDQRRSATARFDTADHRDWTYLPGSRPGLSLEALTAPQHDLVDTLLDTGLSPAGAATARDVMRLDDVLRDIERVAGRPNWRRRGSGRYWIRILGTPHASRPWAWRLNGHHLAVHVTLVGDAVAGAPQFFGANPDVVESGARAGSQVLQPEQVRARELLAALDSDQLSLAVVAPHAPGDIKTRRDPLADPELVLLGIPYAGLRADQRPHLERLVRTYLGRMALPIADAAWAEVVDAGLDALSFAWAGGVEAGAGHYYAVRGPTLLIEYDNVQDNANHAHTVWRDLRHDWNRDVLAEHLRSVPH